MTAQYYIVQGFARQIIVPVGKWYVKAVFAWANDIAMERETIAYTSGGPVYHEYV